MILKSLRLKNFKCYEEFNQDFELGITSICGENGIGKSSILEAISWVLFNFLPYSSNSRIVRNGSKNAEVELTIQSSLDKNLYTIKRKTSGITQVYSHSQKSLIAEGVSNLLSWVRQQLGLRLNDNLASICRNGIATPQGSLCLDFLESTENRRRIFDVLLGLDDYKTVHVSLGETIKILNEQVSLLKVDLARKEFVENELLALTADFKTQENYALSLKTKSSSLKPQIEKLSAIIKESKEHFLSFKELSRSLKDSKNELETVRTTLQKLEELKIQMDALSASALQYEELKEERKNLQVMKKDFENLSVKKSQIEEAIKFETANLERISVNIKEIESFKAELENINPKVNSFYELNNKEKNLLRLLSTLEADINGETNLKQQLEEALTEKNKLEPEILNLKNKSNLLLSLDEQEARLEALRQEYSQVVALENTIKNLSASSSLESIDCLPESLAQANEKVEKLTLQIKLTEADLNKAKVELEFSAKLLPDLTKTNLCPLLNEPCKNLSEQIISSATSQEKRESELRSSIETLQLSVQSLNIELKTALEAQEALLSLNNVSRELKSRSSVSLMNEGKDLKIQVEELRKLKLQHQSLSVLEESLAKFTTKIEDLDKQLKVIDSKKIELKTLKIEADSLTLQLADLKPFSERALVVKSEIQKQEEIQKVKELHEKKLANWKTELAELETKFRSYVDVTSKLEACELSLEKLEPEYLRWAELKVEVVKIPDLKTKNLQIQEQIDKLNSQIVLIEVKLKSEEAIAKLEVELKDLEAESNRLSGEIQSLEKLLAEKNERLTYLKLQKAEMDESDSKIRNHKTTEEKITKMRSYFKELSTRMAKYYTERISHNATGLFRETMQDSSYELVWTEDYEVLMLKNGEQLAFETLSGGQQTAASISIRLGLLQELSNIRFAFFDEPTAHLDVERRNQLALQISSIKSFDQLFVITHDESFASQANNIIQLAAV